MERDPSFYYYYYYNFITFVHSLRMLYGFPKRGETVRKNELEES